MGVPMDRTALAACTAGYAVDQFGGPRTSVRWQAVCMIGTTRVALVGLLLAAAGACATTAPRAATSEVAAHAFLAELADLAAAGDFDALCARGSGNCQRALDEVGEASAPSEQPHVVGTRVLAPRQLENDVWALGGRVLTVCGIDGLGHPYRSEVLVFLDGDAFRAIEAVFWNGQGIPDDAVVGAGPNDPRDPEGC
jgi:hypothetical protein